MLRRLLGLGKRRFGRSSNRPFDSGENLLVARREGQDSNLCLSDRLVNGDRIVVSRTTGKDDNATLEIDLGSVDTEEARMERLINGTADAWSRSVRRAVAAERERDRVERPKLPHGIPMSQLRLASTDEERARAYQCMDGRFMVRTEDYEAEQGALPPPLDDAFP